MAAVGRSLVWAGGWDSIHQGAVGDVSVESGQGSPLPTAVAHYANQPRLLPSLTLGEPEPGEQNREANGSEASLASDGGWGEIDLDGAHRHLCLVTVQVAPQAWCHGPPHLHTGPT